MYCPVTNASADVWGRNLRSVVVDALIKEKHRGIRRHRIFFWREWPGDFGLFNRGDKRRDSLRN